MTKREIILQIEEKKQAAADVLFQYSKFVMASIGNQVRPCDLRLHLMKVILVAFNNLLSCFDEVRPRAYGLSCAYI